VLGIVLINGEKGAVDNELIHQQVRTGDILESSHSSLMKFRIRKSSKGGVALQGIHRCVGSVFVARGSFFSR
jgi:hypothetical protein